MTVARSILFGTFVTSLSTFLNPLLASLPRALVQGGLTTTVTASPESYTQDSKSHEWKFVFKGVAGTGFKLHDLWTKTAWDSGLGVYGHYRSELKFKDWKTGKLKVKQVKLSLCIEKTGQKVELIFNGVDSDISSWFAQERLVSSPWSDLTSTANTHYFSISAVTLGMYWRQFYISRVNVDCDVGSGWMVVIESEFDSVCPWEKYFDSYPVILCMYNTSSEPTSWGDARTEERCVVGALWGSKWSPESEIAKELGRSLHKAQWRSNPAVAITDMDRAYGPETV
ncbi:uncharacterized protein [Asterias amurensis]|uniref:uncharacterized protein n=1 Tax=Asterias amurensis TaxID=7602 RepID=UPI003AB87BF4